MAVPIDDLVQFLVEEFAKDEAEHYGLVIDAPGSSEKFWLAGPQTPDGKEGLVHALSLSSALNQLSEAWDYTSKEIPVHDHSSVVVVTALEAKQHRSSLVLWAPKEDVRWKVRVETLERDLYGTTMQEALFETYRFLSTEGR